MIGLVVILALLLFPWDLEGEGERRPWGTGILVTALAVLHLLLEVQARRAGESGAGSFVYNWFTYGVFPAAFRPHTLVTSQLLHGDIIHLVGNLWMLWIYGRGLERRVGTPILLVAFFATGAVANLAYLRMVPSYLTHIPTIGASAGIAGILGFVLLALPTARVIFLSTIPPHRFFLPAFIPLLVWFTGQLFEGFASIETETIEINHWVHIYGFIAGVLAGLAWRYFIGSREQVATIRETQSLEVITRCEAAGDKAGAAQALATALEAAQGASAGLSTHLQVERARIRIASGKHDEGLREALRLAEDLLAMKDHAGFLQAYVLLETHAPEMVAARPEFVRGAGAAFAELGNAREALRCWMRALSHTSDPELQERLLFQVARLCLQKLNQPEPARACLKALLAAWPTGKLAKEAEFILKRQLAGPTPTGTGTGAGAGG